MTNAPLHVLLDHAATAVAAVHSGVSLDEALARVPGEVRPGTQALAFHALRWLGSADVVLRGLADRAPPPAAASLLQVALALLWPPSATASQPLPYAGHVLVDQAVEAARRRAPKSAGFVNAVLRRFLREQVARVDAALAQPLGRWNHPDWWLDRLRADWPRDWQAIADADNTRAPLTLRVNARRTTASRYVERLAEAGLGGVAAVDGSATVWLDRPAPVAELPGFADGDVSVQDASAQRAAPLLVHGLPSGARVLDACAAPGGKTAQLLELGDFAVTALDRDPARLVRVDGTLARLGLAARTVAADALDPASWWDGVPFDAILLDAPCTASGIVRRHPDVRWLRRPGDVASLADAQSRLLDALWPLLAPGGRLLYATCSVFRAEGQDRIDAFLQRRPDARLAAVPRSPGHLLPLPDNRTPRDDAAAATAGPAAGDGFFLALLARHDAQSDTSNQPP